MAITVHDILKLEGFRHAVVVAGEEGLDNEVKKATLMEVPDIFPFLERKTLILTTLYPIYNDEEALNTLVPRSFQSDAAGLCIKIGRYVDAIPPIMIEQANELSFPLIELHGNDNLSTLALNILSISLDEHISQITFLNSVHYHLMQLFLKGHDTESLVHEFSCLVQAPILLLDSHYQILSASPPIEKSQIQIYTKVQNSHPSLHSITVEEKQYLPPDLLFHPIEAEGRIFGYLILLKADNDNGILMTAVEEASLLFATAFYKDYAVAEKERNFQDAFVRDLLQGSVTSQMESIQKARIYGWEMAFPQVILVVKIYSSDIEKMKTAYEELMADKTIQHIISKKLYSSPKKIMLTYLDDSLVAFVNVAFQEDIKEKLKEIGQLIQEKLIGPFTAGIGISNPILDARSFPSAYEEAQDSLRIGRRLQKGSFVSHIEDNLIYSILKEVENEVILEKFVYSVLGNIIQYDQEHNSQLLDTLYVLIQTAFNFKDTASKLYIHYNTLRYRINRLKELGFDAKSELRVADIIFAYHTHLWLEAKKDTSA